MTQEINEQGEQQQQQQPPEQTNAEEKLPLTWEDVFKHPRFKELNQRAKSAEEKLAQLEKERQEREKKTLEEQNNFRALYEQAETTAKQLQIENLRLKVAFSKGLPPALIERMRGETEEELVKDADELLALFGENAKRGVPPPPRGGSPKIDLSAEKDPEKIRDIVRQMTKK